MPLVLGVDSSTQSTKVEVRDADDGTLVGSGRAPHPAVRPPRSEQDPEAWWEALRLAAAEATADGSLRVAAVSVAAQQHGMVVLGGDGRVLRPAKLWNDTESAAEAERLVARLGPEAWAARTGSVPVAAFTVTKLAWLARHEPETARAVRSVLLPHDYLTLRLTGRRVTDRGDASGTGYFDPTAGVWLCDLLDDVVGPADWGARLPEVLGPSESAGPPSRDGSAGLDIGTFEVVGPGTGDNMAAALGIGLAPGQACLSLGTSGTVYARSDRPVADPTGTIAGFADATGGYLPLACTLNATRVTGTVAGLLGVTDAGLDDLALATATGSSGLTVLPYFDGERTPDRPTATGVIAGLRSGATREGPGRRRLRGRRVRSPRRPRCAGAGGDRGGRPPVGGGRRVALGRVPACRGGPVRSAGAGARSRRGGGHRRVRAGGGGPVGARSRRGALGLGDRRRHVDLPRPGGGRGRDPSGLRHLARLSDGHGTGSVRVPVRR